MLFTSGFHALQAFVADRGLEVLCPPSSRLEISYSHIPHFGVPVRMRKDLVYALQRFAFQVALATIIADHRINVRDDHHPGATPESMIELHQARGAFAAIFTLVSRITLLAFSGSFLHNGYYMR